MITDKNRIQTAAKHLRVKNLFYLNMAAVLCFVFEGDSIFASLTTHMAAEYKTHIELQVDYIDYRKRSYNEADCLDVSKMKVRLQR